MAHDNTQNGQNNGNGSIHENSQNEAGSTEDLRTQLEKAKNDYLYLRAEFDTYRRNVIKERAEQTKYGCERVLVGLLEVYDNFERALSTKVNTENLSSFVKGVEMTAQELRSLLQRSGIIEVPTPAGSNFDPAVHEAVSSEKAPGMNPGAIVRVLRKPYKLHEKLVRPAQVIVAQATESREE
jgi:molecular chaperone GrpE